MLMFPRRTLRSGLLFDAFLVIVLLFLLLTFTSRNTRSRNDDLLLARDFVECLPSSNSQRRNQAVEGDYDDSDSQGSSGNRSRGDLDAKSSVHIDQRLRIIKDSRSKECRKMTYDVRETVTIILHFTDYQLNDLKNTVGSILLHTDMRMVEEIIVVDDASSLDHIVKDAVQYFGRVPKARYLRNQASDQAGVARVRTMAAKEAKTGVLVFLDSWAICNRGWLEPLVDALAKDPNAIVAPHFDRIHDPVSLDYVVETARQVASISWNLAIRVRPPSPEETARSVGGHHYHHSPAVRGNAFAVRKEFFEAVGGYDAGLDGDGGGEHVDLSVRAWLCTGSVKVADCSRVGLLNLFDPVKVSSRRNVRRIAERWFGARRWTVYRSFGLTKSDAARIDAGPDPAVRATDRCRDIDWFLTNVAANMVAPSGDAAQFGILRVRTDRCSRLLPAFDRIKLDECRPEHFTRHRPEMLFELTADGRLRVMGKCLTTKDNAYILAEKCRAGDTRQRWRYRNEELVNVWCNFCAMHVTDPDSRMEGDKQILMAQNCGTDGSNGGLFKKWEFLLP